MRVKPEKKEEQTVCEADRKHRRCVFASKSGGEGRANSLRSRQGSTGGAGLRVNPKEKEEQTVCEADRKHRRCVFASKSGGENLQ